MTERWTSRTRARRAIDSAAPSPSPPPPVDELPRRRLTEAERRALRERRLAALPPLPDEGENSVPPPLCGDELVPEAVRTPPAAKERDRAGGRSVTLGALLFLGLLAVTFGAGGFFGSTDDDPDPTPTVAPTVVAPPGVGGEVPTPAPQTPTAVASPPVDPAAQTATRVRWPGEDDGRTVVCLDPGHGGWDSGYTRLAAAGRPAMAEADYTLAHAYDLAERLRARGVVVVMTRRTPDAVNAAGVDVNGDGQTIEDSARAGELDELQARIDLCNEAEADLLVSLHVNGFVANPEAGGYETWYTGSRPFGDQSARFATLAFRTLGEEMAAAGYAATAREVNNDDTVSIDGGDPKLLPHMVITGPDVAGAIRASAMPGAIVESLFISNDADAVFLSSTAGHEAIVSAYEAAIVQYFTEFPG